MGRLDRYILGQLLRVFGFFSLVLVAVYWVNQAAMLFNYLIAEGQSVGVFLELTALELPKLIRVVLPFSAFVATVYVTLAMVRANEIAVLQAAGLSPWRLARPVVAFGVIVAGFLMVLMHLLIPASQDQLAQRQGEIARNVTSALLQAGVFQQPSDGLTVFVAQITDEGAMRGLFLSDSRSMAQRVDYTARTAMIVPERTGPKLVMIDGFAQIYSPQGQRLSITSFADFTYDLAGMMNVDGRGRRVEELPTRALLFPTPEELADSGATPAQLRAELAARSLDPFFAVATALIGFAAILAGGFSRLGTWTPILGASAALVVLQVLANLGARTAMQSEALAPLVAVPVLLGLGTGAAMLAWAGRRRRVAA